MSVLLPLTLMAQCRIQKSKALPQLLLSEKLFAHKNKYTWGDFGKKMVSITGSCHSSAPEIACVNDYNLDYTIKDD